MLNKTKRSIAWQIIITVLSVIALSALGPTQTAHAADEYDGLRDRWKQMLTGGDAYDPTSPHLSQKVAAITQTAQDHWSSMNTTPGRTYLWADLNSPTASADITGSYGRLYEMALAYSTKGSTLKDNATLLGDVKSGLDWLNTNKYNANTTVVYDNNDHNWWDYEIGTPSRITNTVVLLYASLTSTQTTNFMNAVEHFSPDPTILHGDTVSTGYNRAAKAEVVAIRGVIVKSSTKLSLARDSLTQVFDDVVSGDGFYEDGSFVFHGYHPYTGGYGRSQLIKVAGLVQLLGGSSWAVSGSVLSTLYRWVYDSFEPLMYRGAMMSMVSGREISRDYAQEHDLGHATIGAITRVSQLAAPADAAAFRSMIKGWIQSDTYADFFESDEVPIDLTLVAEEILADSSVVARTEPITYRQFASMDRALVRRPGYALGVSMHSSRIENYEESGDENLKGWHTADGMTYLYDNDLSQYSDNFWPTVDWTRLAGTTVVQGATSTTRRFGRDPWVGGTDILGSYGVTGMSLKPFGPDLSAKKSWFMFDDEVVALGADIRSTSTSPVESIVENRKLNSAGTNQLLVNGTAKSSVLGWSETMSNPTWMHLTGNAAGADVGYYFPGPTTVKGLRQSRTGSWKDINDRTSTSSTSHTNRFMTLWFDHGVNPQGSSYSYVLLPGKTSAQTSAYAANPNITVIENSAAAQAVKENSLNVVGINFWTDAAKTVDLVTVNRRASVMTRETASDIEVSVSDPTQLNRGTIDVEINKSATRPISTDPGITVLQYRPTIKLRVDVAGVAGRALKAKLSLTGTLDANPAPVAAPATSDVEIVDNSDAGFARDTPWTPSAATSGYYGADYEHDGTDVADPTKWAQWTPYIGETGTYDVYMRWAAGTNRPNAAPVEILHAGGLTSVTVNQQLDGGVWVRLGAYQLNAGTSNSVRIKATDVGYTIADAVKFGRTYREECELLSRTASGALDTVNADGNTSGDAWNKLDANGVGDYIDYQVNVPKPGTYNLRVGTKRNNLRGMFKLFLPQAGVYVGGQQDQYSATEGYAEFTMGSYQFATAGTHTVRLVVTGKNASSSGYSLGNDYIELAAQ